MKTFIKLFSFISLLALVGCGASETPITSIPKKEKQYEIIQPQISKAFSEQKYLGTVKANHYAMIHPRREGIVRDILVDTGDQVSVGQTIAYLFPPGVEGQGSSQIAKARATLEAAQESLRNAELVANESVRVAEQKISQVETDLSATGSLDRSDFRRSQLEQAYDQLEQDGTQIYQNIRRVLFGDSLNARSVNSLVGNFNNKLQEQEVFNLYQEVERSKKRLSSIPEVEREFYLNGFLEQLDQLLKESEQLYETADNTTDHSSGEIGSHLSTIQSLQQKILKAQERFDNALLQMDKLSVNLDSTVQNLDLTKSQAQNSIENAQNQVEVASAAYQATLVQNQQFSLDE